MTGFDLDPLLLDRRGISTQVSRAALVREVARGNPGKAGANFRELPFLLGEAEDVLYVFWDVVVLADRTHRRIETGGIGIGAPILDGALVVGAGSSGGRIVESRRREQVATGVLAVTTRNLLFHGPDVAFRIPLERIVSMDGDARGVTVFEDGMPARTLVTGDGRFTGHLVRAAARSATTCRSRSMPGD